MKWDAWSLVFTGLSLTCITSTTLFVLVAINPKDATYGSTPLIYAGGSAALAVAFNRAAAWAWRRANSA
jgi:hypothetical protein